MKKNIFNFNKVSHSSKEAKDKIVTPINSIELPNAGVFLCDSDKYISTKEIEVVCILTDTHKAVYMSDKRCLNALSDFLDNIAYEKFGNIIPEIHVSVLASNDYSSEHFKEMKKGAIMCTTLHQLIEWLSTSNI